jgi:hypothetical protein
MFDAYLQLMPRTIMPPPHPSPGRIFPRGPRGCAAALHRHDPAGTAAACRAQASRQELLSIHARRRRHRTHAARDRSPRDRVSRLGAAKGYPARRLRQGTYGSPRTSAPQWATALISAHGERRLHARRSDNARSARGDARRCRAQCAPAAGRDSRCDAAAAGCGRRQCACARARPHRARGDGGAGTLSLPHGGTIPGNGRRRRRCDPPAADGAAGLKSQKGTPREGGVP